MKVEKPGFFKWEHYPSVTPPELQQAQVGVHPVVVVGAGPVGLTLALTLAQQEIPVVMLEARDQVSDSSRTLAVARRSVQVMDRLGVSAAFREKAITRERNYVYHGRQLIHSAPYEQSVAEKHPDISVLQQPWTEKVLLDAVLENELIDLRWLNAVTAVNVEDQDQDQSILTVSSPQGEYLLKAQYVIAADGARGQVRRSLGLAYEEIGDGVLQRNFIICDFEMPSDLPIARRLWISPPYKPNSAVILHRQPFNTWRLDYALDDGEDIEEAMKPEVVARNVRQQLQLMDIPDSEEFKLVWISSYRPMSRSLPCYRQKSVFFVGDAAHQTPIFGGRGMNQGMLDAANLGWKLGMVMNGVANPDLLDSYDTERRPLIIQNLKDIGLATLCMTAPTRGASLMRQAAFDLLPTERFVLDLVDAFNANKSECLFADQVNETGHTALPGYPLPDCRLEQGAQTIYLHDLLKPHGFTSLYFSANGQLPEGLQSETDKLQAIFPRYFRHETVALDKASANTPKVAYLQEGERLGLQEGTWLLVRPDGYIKARSEKPLGQDINQALHVALGN
ncbi:FAD-dependent monooxygenase [Advenella alkanexedens]|uniref:FAD-dependent monooxygenase n=1 Tax=Advenella alkanexedens TaxID=1481665 RepID=A0ABS6NLK4_9BURK|nr:FAD-dependent monooxygenase [Advenella alkanexedens]MBV4396501.1 FAD-dependent monooxygenase [Advenella alkanexedens]